MKRLLCITANMNAGGAETFLMKIYRNLDKTKYQMDFIVSIKEKNFYEEEIKKMGGKIYIVTPKSKNPIKSFIEIRNIVKTNNYQYVLRVNEHSLSTIDLLAAKFGGAKCLAMRSSNTNSGTKLKVFLHKTFRFLTKVIPTVKLAPSTDAALYTFGTTNNVTILNNALDYDKFAYNEKIRNKLRTELNIEDKFVIGHVGRFNEQKNHKYLVEIFKEYYAKNKNSILLLIGDGLLEHDIKNMVKEYNLDKNVIFLGRIENINEYLQCMDVFVFPSLYEGMPNSVIEAQASGLRCIISSTITREANICDLVSYVDLDRDITNWTKMIQDSTNYIRRNMKNDFRNNGYLIEDSTKKFEKIIFENKGRE